MFSQVALPDLLADPPQNMIAQSQSGTGKTAAFVLAMLHRADPTLYYPQVSYSIRFSVSISFGPFQVLCISPTYELALQTGEVASKMSQFSRELNIRFAVREETVPRGGLIEDQIIIGTPGKVKFHRENSSSLVDR